MRRKNKLVGEGLSRLKRLRPALIAVLALVLAASMITSAMAYRAVEVVRVSDTVYSIIQRTDLSYKVAVKPSVIYDNASVIGTDRPLYTRLVKSVNITYEHSSQALVGKMLSESGVYGLTMTVSSGRGWSKTVELVPKTGYEGTYSGVVVIELSEIMSLIDKLEQETGLASSTYTVTVDITTDSTLVIEGEGEKQSSYTTSAVMEVRLGEGKVSIESQNITSEVSEDRVTSHENTLTILGAEVPVTNLRKYSTTALTLSMIGLLAITLYPMKKQREPDRKYKDVIIDGNPKWLTSLPVVEVTSMRDLVSLARSSGRPIIRSTKEEGGIAIKTYTLLDGGVIYVHKKIQPRQN